MLIQQKTFVLVDNMIKKNRNIKHLICTVNARKIHTHLYVLGLSYPLALHMSLHDIKYYIHAIKLNTVMLCPRSILKHSKSAHKKPMYINMVYYEESLTLV